MVYKETDSEEEIQPMVIEIDDEDDPVDLDEDSDVMCVDHAEEGEEDDEDVLKLFLPQPVLSLTLRLTSPQIHKLSMAVKVIKRWDHTRARFAHALTHALPHSPTHPPSSDVLSLLSISVKGNRHCPSAVNRTVTLRNHPACRQRPPAQRHGPARCPPPAPQPQAPPVDSALSVKQTVIMTC